MICGVIHGLLPKYVHVLLLQFCAISLTVSYVGATSYVWSVRGCYGTRHGLSALSPTAPSLLTSHSL